MAHLLRGPDKEPDPELRRHRFTAIGTYMFLVGGVMLIVAFAFSLPSGLAGFMKVIGFILILWSRVYDWKSYS